MPTGHFSGITVPSFRQYEPGGQYVGLVEFMGQYVPLGQVNGSIIP